MKNLNGSLQFGQNQGGNGAVVTSNGVFSQSTLAPSFNPIGNNYTAYNNVNFNSRSQVKEYSDDIVVDNYQIRIYKLLTINGKNISDIIGA